MSLPLWVLRAILVAAGLAAWFWTQALIAWRAFPQGQISDRLLDSTAPLNLFLWEHPRWANGVLIVTSAVIDLLGIFLVVLTLFGPSIRPFVGLLLLFALRQACQGLCALPAPERMIWRNPGFPSLLVTYGTASDLFFSGHTAIAVYGKHRAGALRRAPGSTSRRRHRAHRGNCGAGPARPLHNGCVRRGGHGALGLDRGFRARAGPRSRAGQPPRLTAWETEATAPTRLAPVPKVEVSEDAERGNHAYPVSDRQVPHNGLRLSSERSGAERVRRSAITGGTYRPPHWSVGTQGISVGMSQ
jgi:hypothetical protein